MKRQRVRQSANYPWQERHENDIGTVFASRFIERSGYSFESRFYIDGTVIVQCEDLMQSEIFASGEGDVRLDDAESALVDRILQDNAHPHVGAR